jgi:hypothetical protein
VDSFFFFCILVLFLFFFVMVGIGLLVGRDSVFIYYIPSIFFFFFFFFVSTFLRQTNSLVRFFACIFFVLSEFN